MIQFSAPMHGRNPCISRIGLHPINGTTYQIVSAWNVLTSRLMSAEVRYQKRPNTDISARLWFSDTFLPSPPSSYEMIFAVWQVKKLVDSLGHDRQPILVVSEFANVLSLSRCHFTRMFKKSFGISPAVFLKAWRIEKALWLVTHTHFKLTDIAIFCGFSDQAHFCRIFKQHIGVRPRIWRNANAQTTSDIGVESLSKTPKYFNPFKVAAIDHSLHLTQSVNTATGEYRTHI